MRCRIEQRGPLLVEGVVMADFSPQVKEHFARPRNAGVLRESGAGTGRASGGGVEVEFRLTVDRHDKVENIGWDCMGCPQTIACCSWASERVQQEPGLPTALDMQQALGLTPQALSRALVVEDALRAALIQAQAGRTR